VLTGQFSHNLWWYGVHFQENTGECFRKIYSHLRVSERYPCISQIGNSLFDAPGSEKVAGLVEKAKKNNVKLVFPVDYITADKFDKDAKVRILLEPRAADENRPDWNRYRGRGHSRRLDGSGRRPQEPRAFPHDCVGGEDDTLERASPLS
jgi:hypothetical protein